MATRQPAAVYYGTCSECFNDTVLREPQRRHGAPRGGTRHHRRGDAAISSRMLPSCRRPVWRLSTAVLPRAVCMSSSNSNSSSSSSSEGGHGHGGTASSTTSYRADASTPRGSAPPRPRFVVYDSAVPVLARVGCGLLSLKATVALSGAAVFGWREVSKFLRDAGGSDGVVDWPALWAGALPGVALPVRMLLSYRDVISCRRIVLSYHAVR